MYFTFSTSRERNIGRLREREREGEKGRRIDRAKVPFTKPSVGLNPQNDGQQSRKDQMLSVVTKIRVIIIILSSN